MTPSISRRTRIIAMTASLACGLGLFFCIAQIASAHATPVSTIPDSGSVVPAAPAEVQIRFSERIEPSASSMTILHADGSAAESGPAAVDSSDRRIYEAPFLDKQNGTYVVSWQVVSADDGHFTKGAFSFSVGTSTAGSFVTSGSQFQVQHSSSIPEGITVWIELLGQAMLIGLVGIMLFAASRGPAEEAEIFDGSYRRRILRFTLIACELIVAGVACYLILKSGELARLQGVTFGKSFADFIATSAARFAVLRALFAIAVAGIFAAFRKALFSSRKISWPEWSVIVLILAMALIRAYVSHAAASLVLPEFSVAVNFIHLVFKEFWIGGLIALAFVYFPTLAKGVSPSRLSRLLIRFSLIANLAIGIAAASGAYIVWLHLKDISNIPLTDWGTLFVLLTTVALIFLAFRCHEQFNILPSLTKPVSTLDASQRKALRYWSYSFAIEMFLGIAVLFLTSVMIIITPPLRPVSNFDKVAQSQDGAIVFHEDPSQQGRFLVEAVDQDPADVSGITVQLTNAEKNIGPIVAPLIKEFDGGYSFAESFLSPEGNWTVDISAQREGKYDLSASFSVDYPHDVFAGRRGMEDRSAPFDLIMVLGGIIGLGFAWYLYRRSAKLLAEYDSAEKDQRNRPAASLAAALPALSWNTGPALAFGMIGFALIAALVALPHGQHSFLRTPFQKQCTADGNMWHESVPMRDGREAAEGAALGCTVGANHFTDYREYRYFMRPAQSGATLAVSPKIPAAGIPARLLFQIRDEAGDPVADLSIDHDKLIHVIIVGSDLETFAHIHPDDSAPLTDEEIKNASFPVIYTFPKAGAYIVAINYMIRAQPFTKKFIVQVAGSPTLAPQVQDFSREKQFGGYDVKVSLPVGSVKAGQAIRFAYHIEKDGKPATDLRPYLSAPMHIALVSADLHDLIHTHGYLPQSFFDSLLAPPPPNPLIPHGAMVVPDSFGPDIDAAAIFPTPGIYAVFGEFKSGGKIIVTQFMVKAE